MVELMYLAEHDTTLKKVASSGGGEWCGPCPFCGGKDRFRVQPNKKNGRWFCRNCGEGKWHDVYDYVMKRDNCTFPQAKKQIDGDNQNWKPIVQRAPVIPQVEREYDPIVWQDRAEILIQWAQDQLTGPDGEETYNWLRDRGLSAAVIESARIGYNPKDLWDEPARWGFPAIHNKIGISHGLIIPNVDTMGIHAIKIRRADADHKNKYIQVKGSTGWIYGAWTCKDYGAAFLFESELDALLGLSTGYCLGYLAMPASGHLKADYSYVLKTIDYIVVMPDNDAAGIEHAEKLANLSNCFVGLLPPQGKDMTEYYQATGHDDAALLDYLYDSAGQIIQATT